MKATLLVLSILLFCPAFSQKKIPSYGKIDVADLKMTDCDFDKGAVAVKLLDYGNLTFERGTSGITYFKTMYDMRVRIKILKDKGMSYANVEIPFYNFNNFEKIVNIDAATYNLDEKGKVKSTDVSKSSIYIKKINKRYSRMIIAFPDVKVGSIIEYKFRIERDGYTSIKDWSFQDRIPTRYSEYEVKIPLLLRFTPNPVIVDSLDYDEKVITDVINIGNDAIEFKVFKQNFIMRNLPGIDDEVYMGSAKDYIQRIEFQLSQIDHGDHLENIQTSWTHVVKMLTEDEDFGRQLAKEPTGAGVIVQQAMLIGNLDARLKFIYEEVRKNMASTDNEAIYTEQSLSNAWKSKTGNAAEINLLLVSLLNQSGIKASPIILSTRNNGVLNTNYHSIDQFNIVMAYASVNGNNYVLDGSDRISHYTLTPERIVNTKGLIIEGKNGKWIDVINNSHKYDVTVAIKGTIDEKGLMTAEGDVSSLNYARKHRIAKYIADPAGFKQMYFITPNPSLTITDFNVQNAEQDSLPFLQKVKFTTPVNTSGEYSYFNTNFLTEFNINPFIQVSRKTDIDFGFQKEYTVYGHFTIPAGYVFETLPENVSISLPDRTLQYSRQMESKNDVLTTRISIKFKSPFYSVANYSLFQEFYKKMIASLNEQVVLKKKS